MTPSSGKILLQHGDGLPKLFFLRGRDGAERRLHLLVGPALDFSGLGFASHCQKKPLLAGVVGRWLAMQQAFLLESVEDARHIAAVHAEVLRELDGDPSSRTAADFLNHARFGQAVIEAERPPAKDADAARVKAAEFSHRGQKGRVIAAHAAALRAAVFFSAAAAGKSQR